MTEKELLATESGNTKNESSGSGLLWVKPL